jgi:hypothetical protein
MDPSLRRDDGGSVKVERPLTRLGPSGLVALPGPSLALPAFAAQIAPLERFAGFAVAAHPTRGEKEVSHQKISISDRTSKPAIVQLKVCRARGLRRKRPMSVPKPDQMTTDIKQVVAFMAAIIAVSRSTLPATVVCQGAKGEDPTLRIDTLKKQGLQEADGFRMRGSAVTRFGARNAPCEVEQIECSRIAQNGLPPGSA